MSFSRGGSFGKWENVPGDRGSASDERMRPNAHKVVNGAESADCGPLLDDNVASKRRCIRQDDVISDNAIVRNVGISHDQRVAAHAG